MNNLVVANVEKLQNFTTNFAILLVMFSVLCVACIAIKPLFQRRMKVAPKPRLQNIRRTQT